MYAEVELSDAIINFINNVKDHNETFDEIKELVFSSEMLNRKFTFIDIFNYLTMFQNIKLSAFNKVLNSQKLNYAEGIIFERLMDKYSNSLIPFNEYLKKTIFNSKK